MGFLQYQDLEHQYGVERGQSPLFYVSFVISKKLTPNLNIKAASQSLRLVCYAFFSASCLGLVTQHAEQISVLALMR